MYNLMISENFGTAAPKPRPAIPTWGGKQLRGKGQQNGGGDWFLQNNRV